MNDLNEIEISVVVPVYRCKKCIEALVSRISVVLKEMTKEYEIILVDDGCPEKSWDKIREAIEINDNVRGIKLSRNFGQHEAITAGLKKTRGKWIVVMDCDLQDKPEEIPNLYNKAMEGFDIVFAKRKDRQDTGLKRLSSKLFYGVLGWLTDTNLDPSVANYGIYKRKVVTAVLSMHESLRYFPVMVRWVGFKSTGINVEHCERAEGETAYSWSKLVRLAIGVMISFSDKPLRLIVKLGFWMSTISAIYATSVIIRALSGDIVVPGWTSVIVSLWFLGGLVLIVLGVVGLYVGRIYDEVKKRPVYIIDDEK